MKNKHLIGLSAVSLSVLILFGSASTKPIGTVNFPERKDDVYSKTSLKEIIKSTKNPTIVVRNLNATHFTTVSGGNPSATLINILEKTLTKNEFVVRDRTLFERSFNQNTAIDYSQMKELTDTDLILEVVEVSNVPFLTNVYQKNNGNTTRVPAGNPDISMSGLKIELKVIKVKSNEIVGTYSFYNTPCINGCFVYKNYAKIISCVNPKNPTYSGYIDESYLEVFTEKVANEFIKSIRN
jgi:hypothetical protein